MNSDPALRSPCNPSSHHQLYPCHFCCSTGACTGAPGSHSAALHLHRGHLEHFGDFHCIFMLVLFRLCSLSFTCEPTFGSCAWHLAQVLCFGSNELVFPPQHIPSLPWPNPNPNPNPFPAQILLRFDFFYCLFPLEKCVNSPWLHLLGHRLSPR